MKYCTPNVKAYPEEAASRDDDDLMAHLYEHYPTLDTYNKHRVDVRHWRRCVIRELLKRGLIDRDPGMDPPD